MDELDPIRALRDDSPDEVARETAFRALRAQIDSPSPSPSRRRRLRWLASSGALGLATVLVIAFWPGGSDDAARLAPASAQAALERAASAAQAAPDRPLKPGEYFYVRDRSAYPLTSASDGAGWSVLVASERETWTDPNGAGRFVERIVGKPRFRSRRDRARWRAAGSPALTGPRGPSETRFDLQRFPAGGSSLTYGQLLELPSNGEAMYRRLLELARDAGPSPDGEAFVIIGDLLRSAPVPAGARAGLYRAAAHIEGVRYTGSVTDELGRRGLAIELTGEHARQRLIFDPDTSQVLVEQTVPRRPASQRGAGAGVFAGYRLVLEQGIVASDTARP